MIAQRRLARWLELCVVGKHDRELIVPHRLRPARIAINDRYRRAPVALTADEPVAHAIAHRAAAVALLLDVVGDGLVTLRVRHTVELRGVHLDAILLDPRPAQWSAVPARRRDDNADLQPELLRELEIAGVVRRNAHHRACAIGEQHVIADPDRHPIAVERVDGIRAGEDARLLALGREAIDLGRFLRLLDVRLHRIAMLLRRQLSNERMLRRKDDGRDAVDGVDARRERPHLTGGRGRTPRCRTRYRRPRCALSSSSASS